MWLFHLPAEQHHIWNDVTPWHQSKGFTFDEIHHVIFIFIRQHKVSTQGTIMCKEVLCDSYYCRLSVFKKLLIQKNKTCAKLKV